MTLTHDVAQHWENCLEVNSSWRQFSRELAILNTFDVLHIEDCEFVAELLENTGQFENVDFNELVLACFDFAAERVVEVEDIDSADLTYLSESGFTPTEVIELALEGDVAPSVISDFAECA
jgi:hypothetical protein